jgi:hypothetical protein
MSLVRVFGNVHLNPACVGKLDRDAMWHGDERKTVTTVYDVTGQHVLLKAETSVLASGSDVDPDRVKRDNFVHREIVMSLNEQRDACSWEDAPISVRVPAQP